MLTALENLRPTNRYPQFPDQRASLTLARLTDEFLHFTDLLADTDPSDAAAIGELEPLLDG